MLPILRKQFPTLRFNPGNFSSGKTALLIKGNKTCRRNFVWIKIERVNNFDETQIGMRTVSIDYICVRHLG